MLHNAACRSVPLEYFGIVFADLWSSSCSFGRTCIHQKKTPHRTMGKEKKSSRRGEKKKGSFKNAVFLSRYGERCEKGRTRLCPLWAHGARPAKKREGVRRTSLMTDRETTSGGEAGEIGGRKRDGHETQRRPESGAHEAAASQMPFQVVAPPSTPSSRKSVRSSTSVDGSRSRRRRTVSTLVGQSSTRYSKIAIDYN